MEDRPSLIRNASSEQRILRFRKIQFSPGSLSAEERIKSAEGLKETTYFSRGRQSRQHDPSRPIRQEERPEGLSGR